MASVNLAVTLLSNFTLTIDGNEFPNSFTQATFTPTVPVSSFKGNDGNQVSIAGAPTWALQLANGQDMATVGSFTNYTRENNGLVKSCTFTPNAADTTQPTVTANVLIVATEFGGKIDDVLSATPTFQINGQPTFAFPSGS